MSTPQQTQASHENRILAALARTEPGNFLSGLERISLSQGKVVYEVNERIEYVYFPESVVFSMLCTMEDGSTVEVGPVGHEGMAGLSTFFGTDISTTRLVVHAAGTAMRVSARTFTKELEAEGSRLPALLRRYAQMLLAMTGQSSACNKLHSIEQQLARWLLMMHDYVGDELLLTQDLIALTLGVRRAGVTQAAINLKDAGAIDYHRGRIQLLDRRRLRAVSCECYGVVRDEYRKLYDDLARLTT